MHLATAFMIGASVWTIAHFLPSRKPSTDDLILETWKQTGTTNRDGLLPQKKKGVWFLPAGLSPADIQRSLPALEYQINHKIEMEVRGKAVILHLYPPLTNKIPYIEQDISDYKLGLVLGKTHKKDCLVLDLNDSSPYLLVAGGVGMGKSNLLNLVLAQINANYSPDRLQYYLLDLKLGVELGLWEDSPLCGGCAWESGQDLDAVIGFLRREVKRRMKKFKSAGVYKVDDYNKLPDIEPLPYLLLIIDEYAELGRDKQVEAHLQHLLQIGRASGLRAIISTQRPTHDLISTSIKGLIPSRICFSVADGVNSDVVLDQRGAEDLGGIQGRTLMLHGAEIQEIQIMLADTNQEGTRAGSGW